MAHTRDNAPGEGTLKTEQNGGAAGSRKGVLRSMPPAPPPRP